MVLLLFAPQLMLILLLLRPLYENFQFSNLKRVSPPHMLKYKKRLK